MICKLRNQKLVEFWADMFGQDIPYDGGCNVMHDVTIIEDFPQPEKNQTFLEVDSSTDGEDEDKIFGSKMGRKSMCYIPDESSTLRNSSTQLLARRSLESMRFVIHNAMSKSVESYYQESGRAGRGNLPAVCIALYAKKDFIRVVCMLRSGQGCKTAVFKSAMAQAWKMQQYCELKPMVCTQKGGWNQHSFDDGTTSHEVRDIDSSGPQKKIPVIERWRWRKDSQREASYSFLTGTSSGRSCSQSVLIYLDLIELSMEWMMQRSWRSQGFRCSSKSGTSEWKCAASETNNEGFENRAPGVVVARPTGLDSLPKSNGPESSTSCSEFHQVEVSPYGDGTHDLRSRCDPIDYLSSSSGSFSSRPAEAKLIGCYLQLKVPDSFRPRMLPM